MIDAGSLRHRVTIQTPTRTANSLGENVITWTDSHKMWCNIVPVTARETMRSYQPLVDTDVIITARYNTWLQADYRLKWERNGKPTEYFNITGIVNKDNRSAEFEIRAAKTTNT